MVNSRNKGASFEREIAQMLEAELGMKFKRDLRQYQGAEFGDLITDGNFPFLVECKRYASGSGMQKAWWEQASRAAKKSEQWPCVIYKFDRQEIRCVVPMSSIAFAQDFAHDETHNGTKDEYFAELTFPAFCYLVRELIS